MVRELNTKMRVLLALLWAWTVGVGAARTVGGRPPNILVFLADDLGIGDLGCYGNDTIKTPHIDRLAREGVRLTHHLSASAMCTPSRAALLTARYPTRYGLEENSELQLPVILHVTSRAGLPPDEVTLATALRAANYTTGLVGKWHLGMNCSFLGRYCPGPLEHGFQSFYGIPVTLFQEFRGDSEFWKFPWEQREFQGLVVGYVVVMGTLLLGYNKRSLGTLSLVLLILFTDIIAAVMWFSFAHLSFNDECRWGVSSWLFKKANSMLFRDGRVVERPIDLDGLSQRLVEESRSFLNAHAHDDQPFFLLHSFGHVHTPMYSADHMKGHSRHGRYGDNVEEMDESVGAVLETLRTLGLEENTIVYFTSDQGGHLEAVETGSMERIGGHNGPFKGGKRQGGTEGGVRVAGIYRWPKGLPAGVTVDDPTSLMDLMPTVLSLAGLPTLPHLIPRAARKELDGEDISHLLLNQKKGKEDVKKGERRIFLHHCGQVIHALRLQDGEKVYKLHLYKTRWHEGSTQCGWFHTTACSCYDDVYDLTHQPHLHDLINDPYEDHPISPDTEEYKVVTSVLLKYLEQWRERVTYPPSQLSTAANGLWKFWLQPH